MWHPQITRSNGPIYRAIADAIGRAIDTGELESGTRLPTHRELAATLRVALTTVTRGYAEAERRGLVTGEVGRGTFVRGQQRTVDDAVDRGDHAAAIDFTTNVLLPYGQARDLVTRMARIFAQADPWPMLDYQPPGGRLRQRTAGALWMERAGVAAPPEQVVVTSGVQHAMAVAFATITQPGDLVLTEEQTYSGMKALANQLHLRLEGLPMDEKGLIPEAFEAACARGAARALYTIPTLHNPRGTLLPESRREAVAAIADRYHVTIVEDDSFGFLVPDTRPIAAYSPRVFYLCGTSKSLAASLRIGFVRVPAQMVARIHAAVTSTTYVASAPMAELVAEWIFDGTADEIMRWKRGEVAARQALALDVMGPFGYQGHPMSQHMWLELPDPWTTEDFVEQARMRGVLITPAEAFVVGRAPAPHAVRVTLGSVSSRATLERGLRALSEILVRAPEPYSAVV